MSELFNISTDPAPTLTDWVAAGSALIGIPLILVSFFKLLLKDRDKQKRLAAIENIAISQNQKINIMQDQVEELAKQTSEFHHQTNLMSESNVILKQQFELQNSIYLDSKDIEEKRMAFEKNKHLASIRPYFRTAGGSSTANSFMTKLRNEGEEAHNVSLTIDDQSNISLQKIQHQLVRNGAVIEFSGTSKTKISQLPSDLMSFEAYLKSEDREGNIYAQRIYRSRSTKSVTIDPPELKNINNML